jgi:hypothetical protein
MDDDRPLEQDRMCDESLDYGIIIIQVEVQRCKNAFLCPDDVAGSRT